MYIIADLSRIAPSLAESSEYMSKAKTIGSNCCSTSTVMVCTEAGVVIMSVGESSP